MSENTKPSHWDESAIRYQAAGNKIYWETLELVKRYQNRCVTGDEGRSIFEFTMEALLPLVREGRKLRALFIGCLEGPCPPEETFFRTGLFEAIEVRDIAGGLLKKQEALMHQKGLQAITYHQGDMNHMPIPEDTYDLVFGWGTIHHLEDLEGFFSRVNRSLKADGVFVMREYIGSNRISFTEPQRRMVEAALAVIPERYRQRPDGTIKNTQPDNWRDTYLADPSESIRSEDLMGVCSRYLDLRKVCYTGGGLLQPLLSDIAGNFEADAEGEALLRLLILLEKSMTEAGALPSDYVVCMAGRREAAGAGYPVQKSEGLEDRDLKIMELMTRARHMDALVVRMSAEYAAKSEAMQRELMAMRATKGWRALEALRKIKGLLKP